MMCEGCGKEIEDSNPWAWGTRLVTPNGFLVKHFSWCLSCTDVATWAIWQAKEVTRDDQNSL